jgi:diphthamide synthase (EF-2-diphthine--ammonia ligase)
MIVTVNAASLGREWLGRTLTLKSLDRLRALGVDPGGENGEFHTVVTGFPGFAHDISLCAQATLEHGGCYLLELEPVRRETSA